MNKFNEFFNKMLDPFLKFVNTKTMMAIKDGFLLTMPITLVGSLFLLIANFPIPKWDSWMSNIFGTDWSAPLNQVAGSTFDILAVVAVLGISYTYAKNEKVDPISTALLSLVSFLILTDSFAVTESGETIAGVIPKSWTGGNGIITAIIVAVIVAKVFAFFIKRDIRIKMPDTVPPGVANAFSAMIPGAVVMFGSMVVYTLTSKFAGVSLTELIFKLLQTPIQNVSDTLPGGLFITFLMSILFWAGIHGPNIVMGIMGPILTANALDNQAVIDSGQQLIVGENTKIMTVQLIDVFAKFGGQGITIGLLFAALMFAKSKRLKEISKISIVPSLFNINEPVIYGLPIVFNPIMLIPFILVPITAVLITYGAIIIGFIQPFTAVQVPWTTPPLISGFLLSGWQGLVVQLVIIFASAGIYYPFLIKQDKQFLLEEAEIEATEETADSPLDFANESNV
ncbi:MAG: PTS sugar transporter subunit IIC [Carnobacterium sp.]|uniref:Permease IIC component n=1 Tax=Carnobacterium antarcticum TaxID=2126436 RepID=A0ABW4NQG1_9LACT|nr:MULTISPECIES: PTS sugar transporter subunit IIC [unclassified Carnobacterium]ALV21401.1 PTS system, cellobiose-specific IIC component [Carnobacterium sp. CP1]QQP69411.1 PTS sugar transporter subunit IIC [Carnobacterium sp. CS13]